MVDVSTEDRFELGHRRRRPSQAEMRQYRAALGTPERRLASALLPAHISDAGPFLAEVEIGLEQFAGVPVLLLRADRDIAFRPKELARWRAALPDACVAELAGCLDGDVLGVRLGAGTADHQQALDVPGAEVFSPGDKGRTFRDWVAIPVTSSADWEHFANAAMAYVSNRHV